jgi:hypothetical protein
VYRVYARDDVNELLAHYEEDLKECVFHLDPDHLTRLAQTLYLLKTPDHETLFWRIEDHAVNQLEKLDTYHITNILRSFAHS